MTTLNAITTINETLAVLRADSELAAALNLALSALREKLQAELPQQRRQPPEQEQAPREASLYPLTIVADRYGGCYSGGEYTAWLMEPGEVPGEIGCGDLTCGAFWAENTLLCGKGSTPDEAERDLLKKIRDGADLFGS